MGRFLKWLAIGVAAVVLVVVIAATALLMLVDPNDYRDDIAALVEEQTGRTLHIEGDIRLSVFPWLGIEMGRVTLSDAEGFYEEPFLEIGGIQAAIRVWPLITGRIETRLFALNDPVVRLMVDADGRANWEVLVERLAGDPPPAREEPEERVEEPAGELPEIVQQAVVAGIEIRRAALHWRDDTTGMKAEVAPVNLAVETIRLGAPIPIRGELRATGTDLPRIAVELETRVEMSRELDRLRVHDLQIDLDAQGEMIPGGGQAARLAGWGEIGLGDTVAVEWPELRVNAAGLELIAAAFIDLGEEIEGEIPWQVLPFSPKTTMGLLDLDVPTTADPDALTRVAAEGRLRIQGERLEVNGLRVELDGSVLSGEAVLEEPVGPSLAFDLHLDAIDVDRYLPPEEDTAPAPEEPTGEPAGLPDLEAIALDLPLEPLRTLNLDGNLRIGEARAAGLRVADFEARLEAGGGRLRADPVSAELYGGEMTLAVGLDARGDWPYIQIDQRLHDIRFAPLLEDLMEGDALLDGRGRFELRGEGGGANVYALVEDFRGEAELRVSEGAVQGINIVHLIQTAVARVRGERPPEAPDEGERTDFAGLSATIQFRDGVAHNDDLRVESPLLRVSGDGRADILRERVDYRLRVSLVETLDGQDGKPVEELRGVTIPIRITGDLLAPSFRLDLAAALGEERMRMLREGEEAIRQRLDEERQRLEDEARKAEEAARRRAEEEAKKAEEAARRRLEEEARDRIRRLR